MTYYTRMKPFLKYDESLVDRDDRGRFSGDGSGRFRGGGDDAKKWRAERGDNEAKFVRTLLGNPVRLRALESNLTPREIKAFRAELSRAHRIWGDRGVVVESGRG